MDVHQAPFKCRVWQRKRARILERCEEEAGFDLRKVSPLQESRKITAVELGFLMDTKIGLQPQEQEQREEEQGRQRDRE